MNRVETPYKKEKRDINDNCNICGEKNKLTWDHVPPKFCFNNDSKIHKTAFSQENKNSTSQNGIKYRSICDNCNNKVLGRNYDIEYSILVKGLKEYLQNNTEICQYIKFKVKVNKIARAIIGHFLAAKNYYDNDTKIDVELRKYFLNPQAFPPHNFKLFYYYYPYNTIMIIRDIACKKMDYNKDKYPIPEGCISCLNSFPLAFIIATENNDCKLDDLFSLCTNNIEEEIELILDINSIKYNGTDINRVPNWPCNISDEDVGTSMVLCSKSSDSSVMAYKKQNDCKNL